MGDLSGKAIIPLHEEQGRYTCTLLGAEMVARNDQELAKLERKIANMGFYSHVASRREIEELERDPKRNDELFQRLIVERLRCWMDIADERLRDLQAKMYIGAGNDDPFAIDPILDSSEHVINLNERLVAIDGYEVVTTAFSNPTPWSTPRECSEGELRSKIEQLVSKVDRIDQAVFNFHVPPYGTLLDLAPELKDLQPQAGATSNVGSTAVAETIREHQPLLGLHGHIHESRAAQKLGRTLCVNPGSEYSEEILRGVQVILEKEKVKSYIFTSG